MNAESSLNIPVPDQTLKSNISIWIKVILSKASICQKNENKALRNTNERPEPIMKIVLLLTKNLINRNITISMLWRSVLRRQKPRSDFHQDQRMSSECSHFLLYTRNMLPCEQLCHPI